MRQEKVSKTIARGAASVLNSLLHVEANSTSCVVVYQPKAPKELERFRKEK